MVWPTSTSQHDDLWRKKRQASSDPINPYPNTGSHQSRTDFVLVYVPYGDLTIYESYRIDSNIDDDTYENWYKKGVRDRDGIRDSDFVWELVYTG
ncbi:hypothetical protein [Candidatus Azobacteroides pseudotrichonymphae]|uniref:hypothetical protein n=1 Tax=Candidatus Azobacteroides pseudotrichonymphae TaxID=511435 RepID=UPI0005A12E5A|nr:hypothetical protein [Candidatus Azobacteroides pseudotrichonymphae]